MGLAPKFQLFLGFTIIFLPFCLTNTLPNPYDQECHIDKNQPATGPNYVVCTDAQMLAADTTSCCKVDADVGCCNKNAKFDSLKWMLVGIGLCTFALMTVVFCCMWCNKKTFPFLQKFEDRLDAACLNCQRKTPCCKNKVETRRRYEEELKKTEDEPEVDMPPELRVEAKEDFFEKDPNQQNPIDVRVSMSDLKYIE